jgi:hypothetical protein
MDGIQHLEVINDISEGNFIPFHSPAVSVKKKVENLPFSVTIVRNEERLHKAVELRQAAYARHLPELAEKLREPEALDHDRGTLVLIAESRMDGSALGTLRIQGNDFRPLLLEQSITLPEQYSGKSLAEATRLGVDQGRVGLVVKTALFKAFYLVCLEAGIDWMVIAGRAPMDRQYVGLQFEDVNPNTPWVPLRHASNIPHRVMAFEIATAERRWRDANHKLYDFMVRTVHPDIDVAGAESLLRANKVDERHSLRIMGIK